MRNIFFTSDTHFGHDKILKFTEPSGALLRPEFTSTAEMDETIVQNWNSVVGPEDIVYHLGDVTMRAVNLPIVARLNGTKILILGNHDKGTFTEYFAHFSNVKALHNLSNEGLMLSHIPIHPDSIKQGFINVHGHIHRKVVAEDTQMVEMLPGVVQHSRYFNVCVEQHNYTPVHMDQVRAYKAGSVAY